MFTQARKLKNLETMRKAGAISSLTHARERAQLAERPRERKYYEPENGFLLTQDSVENGRVFVRIAIRVLVVVVAMLVFLVLFSR